jgi:predicted ATP-dependent endonuclease of OLD family
VEKIRILSYKTIVSEQELDVDPKITVLIGGNETGKTNVLQAINKFSMSNNFETEDISRSSSHYRREILPSVGIVFSVSKEEQQKLTAILPILADSNKLEIWKRGNGLDAYHMAISEERIAEFSRKNEVLQRQISTVEKDVKDANQRVVEINKRMMVEKAFVAAANAPLDKKQEAEDRLKSLMTQFSEISAQAKEKSVELEGYKKDLSETSGLGRRFKNGFLNLSPEEVKGIFEVLSTIYFPEEIPYLPEKVSIPDLISHPRKDKNKIVSNLLKLGEIEDLKILQASTRRRSVVLRKAEELISERLNHIWKQEKIEFQISADEKSLELTLREPVSIAAPPEERSEGFRWFLSFYAQFIVDAHEQLKNTLVLLDDPAIRLHPNGQKDFLAVLDEIAEGNQVIYTAHSPFLINKNFPGRARLLTKNATGTSINNKPHSDGKSRFWEPLRSAIGVCLGDSLFLNQKNVVVEGVSDQIILTGFNHKFAAVGKPYIDMEKVAIVAGMGADSVVQIALLAYAEDLEGLILLDSDNKGDSTVARIENKAPQLKEKIPIIRTKDFKKDAQTLEDLIPVDDYLKAVNSAYARTIDGFKEISPKDFIEKKEPKEATDGKSMGKEVKNTSVIHSIIAEFKKCEYGDFDKVLVAKELVNTIEPNDVENDKYNHLSKLFIKAREHFKLK